MNGQNNNFNSQFNNQNNPSAGGQPAQPVKNRFFSPDLFNDADVNAVGSSTSNSVNNNVISWGVGKKNDSTILNNQNNMTYGSSLVNNGAEELLEQVNGKVYEVLEDDFLVDNNDQQNNKQFAVQNNSLFQEANTEMPQLANQSQNNYFDSQKSQIQQQQSYGIQQPMPVQQPVLIEQPRPSSQFAPVQQPMPQNNNQMQNQSWKDGIGVVSSIGEEWMHQQPLSASTLGVQTLGEENTKDVIEESKFFSPNIGNIVEQNMQEQKQQFAMQYGNSQGIVLDDPAPEINDMVLLKQFVGSAFTKITMSPFSFSALIFGGVYFIYRKMTFIGVILIFVEFFILNLISPVISLSAILVLRIVIALAVNPLYIGLAKNKIKRIRKNKKNKMKNQIELNTICQKKGGTNLAKTFLLLVLCAIVEGVLTFTVIKESMIYKIYDFISTKITNTQKNSYDGTINLSSYDVYANMEISVPSAFKKDGDAFKYVYTSGEVGVFNTCTLSIGKLDNFTSGEEFINQYIEYEELDINIGKTNTKGITWYTISRESSMGKQFYRAALINNDVVLLDYSIGKDTQSGICDAYLAEIIDSISLKEK